MFFHWQSKKFPLLYKFSNGPMVQQLTWEVASFHIMDKGMKKGFMLGFLIYIHLCP